MSKVTPLPAPNETSDSHIGRLYAIADGLEARADALRRHAMQIRRHAASLQNAAGRLRKCRQTYAGGARAIR